VRVLTLIALGLSLHGLGAFPQPAAAAPAPGPSPQVAPRAETASAEDLLAIAPQLPKRVLQLALAAFACARARGLGTESPLLTVIDYSQPSTAKRLWVLDTAARRLIFHELVAHGQGTGENRAVRFSNAHGSRQTSLGLFLTAETYDGENGYSLRLDGLDPGFNDQARARAIVMHGAPYVSREFEQREGRLGRSWGCPALTLAAARKVIDTIGGGSLLFAYGADPAWLAAAKGKAMCASEVGLAPQTAAAHSPK
jgi:hypothetical protein